MHVALPAALFDIEHIVTRSPCITENGCPDSDPPKPLSFKWSRQNKKALSPFYYKIYF